MSQHQTTPPLGLATQAEEMDGTGGEGLASTQVRGSSLLLAGRFIALVVDFAAQVLLVRYLAKGDYGTVAWALAIVSLGSSLAVFGLDKTLSRFLPLYEERRDAGRMFGSIAIAVAAVLLIGTATVLLFRGGSTWLTGTLGTDDRTFSVLLVLIVLAPVQALDSLLIAISAALSSPRSILFRRYIIAPALQLAVVSYVVLVAGDVTQLAIGYVAAGALGVAIYVPVLVRLFKRRQIAAGLQLRQLRFPVRELFGYSLPLLWSDLVFVMRGSLVVVLIEYLRGTSEVASFRAVLPMARMNLVVLQSFAFLFLPLASRMFARADGAGLAKVYWTSATWVTVLSLPIFLVSFSLADPVVDLLYGARYEDSTVIQALLALGFFVHGALGVSGLTLRAVGRVRYLFTVDVVTAVSSIVLTLVLIDSHGALGAAVATAATLVAQSLLYSWGLRGSEIHLEPAFVTLFVVVIAVAVGLIVLQAVTAAPLAIGVALAVAVSFLIFRWQRPRLRILAMFPELERLPLIARFLA